MPSPKDYSPFVPFDLYDFFGYLFPGTMLAAGLLGFFWRIHPEAINALFVHQGQGAPPSDLPFLLGLTVVVFSIVALYTIGHFVATISHILIDRVLVDGIEGYPYIFLLGMKPVSRPYSEATFKYLFALFNLSLFIPSVFGDVEALRTSLRWIVCTALFLIVQRFVIMICHRYKDGRKITARLGNVWPFKLFLLPSMLLIDPLIDFLRKLLGMDRPFSDAFITHYKVQFKKTYGQLSPDEVGSENYWLSAFHARSASSALESTLQTWLHLYGFARNTSAALYLAAALIVGHLYMNPQVHSPFMRIYLFVILALAAGLGIRYWILYSHYYSKGVFRAFVDSTTSAVEKKP